MQENIDNSHTFYYYVNTYMVMYCKLTMQESMDYTPKPFTSITGVNTYYRHCGTTLQLTRASPTQIISE